jgi:mono/diheme cytochrome c family protein
MRTILFFSFLLVACTKTPSVPQTPAEKGRTLYNAHCIACHNVNPRLDGAVGPALYGSNLDLLQHRVLEAKYPAGYTPKRATHIMQPLPFLKDEIPNLQAYLNAP